MKKVYKHLPGIYAFWAWPDCFDIGSLGSLCLDNESLILMDKRDENQAHNALFFLIRNRHMDTN